MDKEKINLIVKNLELLIECLKKELNSEKDTHKYEEIATYLEDYDEVFYDEDDEYDNR